MKEHSTRAFRCTVGLPVWQAKGDFIKMINEHQTTILVGETGSGKTTQIAQFITEAGKLMDIMAIMPCGWLAAPEPVQSPCASGCSLASTRPLLPSHPLSAMPLCTPQR